MNDEYVYAWSVETNGLAHYLVWSYGVVDICSANQPLTLAIDAALEFMDRYMEQAIPRWIESPAALMGWCFDNARTQR